MNHAMNLLTKLGVAVLLSALSLTATALESHGVRLPDSVTVEGRPLKLNGTGVRTKTIFNIKVYTAGLYLETASDNADRIIAADSPWKIELLMTHNAPRDRVHDEIRAGFTRNSEDKMALLKERLDGFLGGVPALKEGEALSIAYTPGKGTRVQGAGGSEVTVPGKDFAAALLAVWLGKNALDDDLKKRLLGAP